MKRFAAAFAASLLAGCAAAPQRATTSAAPVAVTQPQAAAGVASAAPSSLAAGIEAFIAQARFAHADWGIQVVSLDDGAVLYAHDAQKLFVPASNAKLYVAALALAALGPDARIGTTLYATAQPRSGGALDGDLILYGRGDPSLGEAQSSPDWADRLAAALKSRGVQRVHGDLVADDTFFAGPPFGSGWEAGDLQSWYAMPVSALSVQGNLAHVRVARDGSRCCVVGIDATESGLQMDNLTGSATAQDDAPGLYRAPGSDVIVASGDLPPGVQSKSYALSVPDPALYAGSLLRAALARAGIAIDGRVRSVHWPHADPDMARPGLVTVAGIASPPLSAMLAQMLKHSDNLYAQSLLLQAGVRAAQAGACADRAEPPRTSEEWGLCALRGLLARAGIAADEATFEEGAGLSRKDLVAPAATTRLLAWIARQPFAAVLRDALPVAGEDGTLRNRLRGTAAEHDLQAKTGTLAHAYALSGYVTDDAGRHLAFSLMLDHYQRPTDGYGRDIEPAPASDLDAVAAMIAANAH